MPSLPKTPGVYVQEIPTLPPSVAEVATAIPAFIGYTEKSGDQKNMPTRIGSMVEYVELFGGAPKVIESVTLTPNPEGGLPSQTVVATSSAPLLYYSLRLYFANGGGPCYIVSVGDYTDGGPSGTALKAGIASLEKEDEPTLIVIPDSVRCSVGDHGDVCGTSLTHCGKMGDRFAILDVKDDDEEAFRNSVPQNYLKYGAAYLPSLQTTIPYAYDEKEVSVSGYVVGSSSQESAGATEEPAEGEEGGAAPAPSGPSTTTILGDLKDKDTALYNSIKATLAQQRAILPPSGAMAGIYARVDRDRGVWKAPANVGVSSVVGLTKKVTDAEQEGLNVDATSGKSINVIRAFSGKGILVWGARTLAGNDNEWRYVSVRRLFNLIEESTKKASAFAVFEPNDATTWLKVKAMIESYLYSLWERGALAGPTPDSAYFVNVGLGLTMTTQDILEGRMNVEIGVAAVRPAEFIILKFSHKLQEA